jgi:hypothetical protein
VHRLLNPLGFVVLKMGRLRDLGDGALGLGTSVRIAENLGDFFGRFCENLRRF